MSWITQWQYLGQETWRGLRRGGWMNWAAASTVAISLFLFGLGLQSAWYLEATIDRFGSQLEISVYLQPGERADAVVPRVEQLPQVAAVSTITKEAAWADLVRELGISNLEQAEQQLEGNPLVDELKVQAVSAEALPELAAQLTAFPEVDETRYVDEAIRRLRELNRVLGWFGLGVTLVLVSAAIATITTTIRLVVVARQREIEIMQLVGATRGWIYLPFVLQGLVFGVQGAIGAWLAIGGTQRAIAWVLSRQPNLLQVLVQGLTLNLQSWLLLLGILLAFGCGVGLTGSALAVRSTTTAAQRQPWDAAT